MRQQFKLIIFLLFSSTTHAYIPSHLESYEASNTCAQCDLTRITTYELNKDPGRDYINSSITDTFLTNSKLEEINFQYSSFNNVNFILSRLSKINISYGKLINVDFNSSLINHSHFDNSNFLGVNFKASQLVGSSFTNAQFKNTVFDDANLEETDFSNATFENTSFVRAKLDGANFIGSNVSQKQLDEALSHNGTVMPDGSIG